MEKDKLKGFIQDHQEEFEMLEPSSDLWKGIEPKVKKKKGRFDSKVLLRIAASLFFVLGAAWIALQIGNLPGDQVAEETGEPTVEGYDYAFSGISDELAEVEHYYVSEVALKRSELSNYEVDEELLEELEQLDAAFEQLKCGDGAKSRSNEGGGSDDPELSIEIGDPSTNIRSIRKRERKEIAKWKR